MIGVAIAVLSVTAGAAAASSFGNIILPPPVLPGAAARPYVRIDAVRVALTHVRLIDGTGAAELADLTVVLENGKVVSISSSATPPPTQARVLDLSGQTGFAALVSMYDHLY